MRHRMRGRTLSRTAAHRKALRQNIANSLFIYGRIVTTLEKAKETKSFATLAKKGLLKKESDKPGYVHCYRQIFSQLRNIDVVRKLLGEGQYRELGGIAQRYVNRNGGYTRILKMSGTRLGVLSGSSIGKIPLLEYKMEGRDRKLKMLGRRLNDNASQVVFELVEGNVEKQAEEVKPVVAKT